MFLGYEGRDFFTKTTSGKSISYKYNPSADLLGKYLDKCLAACKQRLYNAFMASDPYTIDTSADAFEVQLGCLRRMSPQQRIRQTCALSRSVKKMAIDAISRRYPDLSDELVQLKFIELTYGEALAVEVCAWMREHCVDRNG